MEFELDIVSRQSTLLGIFSEFIMSKRIWNRIQREGFISEIKRFRVKFLFLRRKIYNILGLHSILPKHEKSFYGPLMSSNWRDVTFRFCIRGSYGTLFSDYLKDYKKPFFFIDIGANQGLYSLIAGSNTNCLKVLAFEPVPVTAAILAENIKINNLNKKSEVHVKAISDKNGTHGVHFDLDHSGITNIDQEINENQSNNIVDIETVDATYLNKLNIPEDIDIVIKLDVEGHERVVIEQLVQTNFLHNVGTIYYEYDTRLQNDMDIIKDRLKQNDFIVFSEVKDEEDQVVFNMLSTKKH